MVCSASPRKLWLSNRKKWKGEIVRAVLRMLTASREVLMSSLCLPLIGVSHAD
eukprot:c782_g1_i1 orf=1-159(-)